ncbi:MAG: dTDP-4-dehydrorhamnose reductase [Armatimonadota bacterium]|jgi:dTDP-4-dehydrorhamnose reductase
MADAATHRRTLVTGAEGMLGTDLCDALRAAAPDTRDVIGLDLPEFDVTDLAECRSRIPDLRPDCVIHCAGYTNVEGCTHDPIRAYAVNGDGTRNVAEVAEDVGAHVVYLSTDYVFDGAKGRPYVEQDTPNPINAYGESKLLGEEHVRSLCGRWHIVRTQWLFGPNGPSFPAAILKAARRDGRVRAVGDQVGSPTYTRDLSQLICRILELPTGIYHATNSGSASWHDVAAVALEAAGLTGVELQSIPAAEWDSPTARPAHSVLENAALRAAGVPAARPWDEALREFLASHMVAENSAARASGQ